MISGSGRSPGEGIRIPTPVFLGFPGGSDGKVSACNEGDPGSIPGLGRSPGEGNGNPLQYSCLKRSLVGYSPWGRKEGVTKSWTRLSNFTFTFQWLRLCLPMQGVWVRSLGWEDPLEEGLATHSGILAWRSPMDCKIP